MCVCVWHSPFVQHYKQKWPPEMFVRKCFPIFLMDALQTFLFLFSDWFHLLLCWSYLTKLEYTFYTKIWLISGKPELHILQLLTLSRFFLPTPELIYSKLSRPWKSIPEIIWHILSRPPEFVTLHACTSIFICHIFGNNNYCTSWKYETI